MRHRSSEMCGVAAQKVSMSPFRSTLIKQTSGNGPLVIGNGFKALEERKKNSEKHSQVS